jgi:hypothetical protein
MLTCQRLLIRYSIIALMGWFHEIRQPAESVWCSRESVRLKSLCRDAGILKAFCFDITPRPREFDLVADITKLVETFKPEFTPFVNGISRILCR